MSQSQSLGLGGAAYIATASLATKQFYAVIADTANAGSVIIATANSLPLGFLQNKPAAGEIAEIRGVRGTSTKAVAGAAISKGDKVQVGTGGKVITGAGAAQLVCGIAMEAATADLDIIEVFLLDSYVA